MQTSGAKTVGGRLRAGDPARAAIVLAIVLWASVDTPRAAIALVLVAPPALALRMLRVDPWLDGALCTVLLVAQVGAELGFTQSTSWWDSAAHALTGALVGVLVARLFPHRGPAAVVFTVAVLAACWEVAEALSDRLFATDFAPSRGDTLSDLGMGIAGAILAIGTMRVWARQSVVPSRRPES